LHNLTVRDVFKRMMRDEVAPALRELGFKGSGVNFTLPSPELHLMIHFQVNDGIPPETLDFTVNISIINKSEYQQKWQPWLPRNPTAATILPTGRRFRIGALVGHVDKWWHIEAAAPAVDQAFDVVRTIGAYVVPELKRGSMRGPSLNREQYDDS
jgi:hypothetical protein